MNSLRPLLIASLMLQHHAHAVAIQNADGGGLGLDTEAIQQREQQDGLALAIAAALIPFAAQAADTGWPLILIGGAGR